MIFKFLFRSFMKVTGLPIFYPITKQMRFFSSAKAKEQHKSHKKEGVILISNHPSFLDYCSYLYLYFFKHIRTFASELMYRSIFMKFFNWVLGNIHIDRNKVNLNSLVKAEELLNKHKTILIFPEGKIEKTKGSFEEFHESAVILAFRTNSAIVPHYVSGDYSLFKRNRVMIGERIYVRDLVKKDTLSKEDVKYCLDYIKNEMLKLKSKVDNIKKTDVKTCFTRKYWVLDIAKITTVPVRFLLWNTKRIYLGDKKEINKCLKYNCLLTANHKGFTDVFFFYLYTFRRLRIIATNKVYEFKFLNFCMRHSNVIRYNVNNNNFDYSAFKEAIDTLDATGIVGIFPEGHLNKKEDMLPIHEGLSLLSLSTSSPIVPVYFLNEYRYLRRNKVIIGKPIYPDKNIAINKDAINIYNDKIIKSFKELKDKANNL